MAVLARPFIVILLAIAWATIQTTRLLALDYFTPKVEESTFRVINPCHNVAQTFSPRAQMKSAWNNFIAVVGFVLQIIVYLIFFRCKQMIVILLAMNGFLSMVVPFAKNVRYFQEAMIICLGAVEGMFVICSHMVLSYWYLAKERPLVICVLYISEPISWIFMKYLRAFNPSCFSWISFISCIVAIATQYFITKKPHLNVLAQEPEVQAIEADLRRQREKKVSSLLSSAVVYGNLIGSFTYGYAYFALTTVLPSIVMMTVGGSLTLLETAIFRVCETIIVLCTCYGFFALMPHVNPVVLRMGYTSTGFLLTSAMSSLLLYSICNKMHAVMFLNLNYLFLQLSLMGFMANIYDVSPRLSGYVCAISQFGYALGTTTAIAVSSAYFQYNVTGEGIKWYLVVVNVLLMFGAVFYGACIFNAKIYYKKRVRIGAVRELRQTAV